MPMQIIKTSTSKDDPNARTASFEFDFGGNVETAIKKFGGEVVYSLFVDAAVIQAQGIVRRALNIPKGEEGYKSEATIVKDMADWKPKMGRVYDPVKKIETVVKSAATLTPEQRAELRAQLDALDAPAKPPVRSKPVLVKKGRAA